MRKPIVGRFLFGDVRAITSPVGTKKKKDPVLKIKDLLYPEEHAHALGTNYLDLEWDHF